MIYIYTFGQYVIKPVRQHGRNYRNYTGSVIKSQITLNIGASSVQQLLLYYYTFSVGERKSENDLCMN